jgi:hypothetical protein
MAASRSICRWLVFFAFLSLVPHVSLAAAGWIVEENLKPGTRAWRIADGTPRDVEGFANRVSVAQGRRFRLYVSTTAPSYTVTAYRLGYYQGLGGRRVWGSGSEPGMAQAATVIDPETNMVEARWSPSLGVRTTGWPEGSYLLKLVSSAGGASYVPMVVRNDASIADLVIQHQVNTWQAYNRWGGYSLYLGHDGFSDRSRVVSFDRPYDGSGGTGMLRAMPFIALAEQRGLDVTYITDVDLHRRPITLLAHRSLVLLNHSEYWSSAMRDAVLTARSSGVNLANFGANTMYRHIRFEDSPLGVVRRIVCFKVGREDPLWGMDPAEVTVNWREPPVPRPESAILGAMYRCHGVTADLVVSDAEAWVFSGTGLKKGAHIDLAVSGEIDRIHTDAPTPANVRILAHSPVGCGGPVPHADMTYYTAVSGAGVFDAGATDWYRTLRCGIPYLDARCDARAVKITANVMEGFAEGPAGLEHPSVGNASSLGYDLADPIFP